MYEIKIYVYNPTGKPVKTDHNYTQKMHGFVSNLMGDNNYGNIGGDYHYSKIYGLNPGGTIKPGFIGYFIVRMTREKFKSLTENWDKCKNTGIYGLELYGLLPSFTDLGKGVFKTNIYSPIMFSTKSINRKDSLSDDELRHCEKYLMNNIKDKANALNFTLDENLSIRILKQNKPSYQMLHRYRNVGRVFDLEINCNEETKEFILINGLGQSSKCGFGFIE